MNRIELRQKYELILKELDPSNDSVLQKIQQNNSIWKTNHSLQLTRLGFMLLKRSDLPIITIQINNGRRSISELLMLANTMLTPYYLTEHHVGNFLSLITVESDRAAMLIMQEGNISNWAAMYKND